MTLLHHTHSPLQHSWASKWSTVVLALTGLGVVTPSMAQSNTTTLRADLQTLSQQRIFFGHQSVGDDLLEGIKILAKEAQVPLNVTQLQSAQQIAGATLGHTHVAENTQPLKKLQSFERAMAGSSANVDLALIKFCYIDFHPGTDVKQLFGEYQRTVTRLGTAHPKLKWLHVTTPLTAVQSGWKASLKKLIGKAPHGMLENIKREEYNQLIRQTYGASGNVFDLAKAEATQPDGKHWKQHWNGTDVPALYPGYTHDGEHLNPVGQKQVASAFVQAVALQAKAR